MTETRPIDLPVFRLQCRTCGEWHTDLPAVEVPAPMNLLAIPEAEWAELCFVAEDACVIDRSEFYVRGIVELPILGFDRVFAWMVWVSLSRASVELFADTFEEPRRSHVGPFFGWLDSPLPVYPRTQHVKTAVYLRDDFQRPMVLLDCTDHPLAVEQHRGMSIERVADLVASLKATGWRVRAADIQA